MGVPKRFYANCEKRVVIRHDRDTHAQIGEQEELVDHKQITASHTELN